MLGKKNGLAAATAVLLLGSASPVLAQDEGVIPVPEPQGQDDAPPQTLPDLPTEPTAADTRSPGQRHTLMVHRANRDLLGAGMVILGISWTAAVLWTAGENFNCDGEGGHAICGSGSKLLFVPVAGPLLAAGHIEFCSGWTCPTIWSAIQAAGAALIIAGAIGHDVPKRRAGPEVSLLPVLSPRVSALALNVSW